MKLTKEHLNMFDALSRSGIGADLAVYIDELCDEICDARNWGPDDTKESAVQAAKHLKEQLRNKIVTTKKRESKPVETYF